MSETIRPLKDAATVLLLRPAEGGGVEVFMQVRAATMAFAAGAAVFPGGSVDPSDLAGTEAWDLAVGADFLRTTTGAHPGALVAAAIRETYEECGVLLAGPPTGAATEGAAGMHPGDRESLANHSQGIARLLGGRGLRPSLSGLACVDRWITPLGEPRRYDTRFFAAELPPGQEADGLTTESVRSFWVRPGEALARFSAGELALMPPTWAQLERLGRAADVGRAMLPATTGTTMPTLVREAAEAGRRGRVVARFWGTEEYLAAAPS